jgi:hypothetical protein
VTALANSDLVRSINATQEWNGRNHLQGELNGGQVHRSFDHGDPGGKPRLMGRRADQPERQRLDPKALRGGFRAGCVAGHEPQKPPYSGARLAGHLQQMLRYAAAWSPRGLNQSHVKRMTGFGGLSARWCVPNNL